MVKRMVALALCVVSSLGAGSSVCRALEIWAVDDAVRIDPQTGNAWEDNAIYPSPLRMKPGYREKNWVFDKSTRLIRLAGARNEVVAFQLQIESPDPLKNVEVAVSNLKGPAPFGDKNSIRLFKAWYVEVKQPSYGESSLSATTVSGRAGIPIR